MPFDVSFAEMDRLEAERRAKARDLVERLAKALSREFSYQELRFIRDGRTVPLRSRHSKSPEIARSKDVREMGSNRPVKQPANLPKTPKPDIKRPTPKTVPLSWPHPKPKEK